MECVSGCGAAEVVGVANAQACTVCVCSASPSVPCLAKRAFAGLRLVAPWSLPVHVRLCLCAYSIASRIDCFMDTTSAAFGEKMKEQVEERLRFYEEGVAPRKNLNVMQVRACVCVCVCVCHRVGRMCSALPVA